jgi:parallel beta-helix repeat protein
MLAAPCSTTEPLEVPNGQTINGGGFTITASGSPLNTVRNRGVLYNGGATMNVTNLTIQGMFGPGSSPLVGIFFDDASGTVNNVKVLDITTHNGAQDVIGIRARAVGSPTRHTVTITNSRISGYGKGALIATGNVTMNVSGSTIGPPDALGNIRGQNGVQFGTFGAGGSITNSTIIGSGFLPGPDVSTAILLTGAGPVTISNNTITGDTDVGIAVTTDSFFSDPPLPVPMPASRIIGSNELAQAVLAWVQACGEIPTRPRPCAATRSPGGTKISWGGTGRAPSGARATSRATRRRGPTGMLEHRGGQAGDRPEPTRT